ncbi:hypothetical protein B0H11DRAFT_2061006 [Mycena galericulata]|nr:hypothetical protein B0H11DRAFT_2061006 [Mycena galericulata]
MGKESRVLIVWWTPAHARFTHIRHPTPLRLKPHNSHLPPDGGCPSPRPTQPDTPYLRPPSPSPRNHVVTTAASAESGGACTLRKRKRQPVPQKS